MLLYWSCVPSNRLVRHMAFWMWVWAQIGRSTNTLQKCSGSYQHTPKKGCFNRPAKNQTPPDKVTAKEECTREAQGVPISAYVTDAGFSVPISGSFNRRSKTTWISRRSERHGRCVTRIAWLTRKMLPTSYSLDNHMYKNDLTLNNTVVDRP